MKIIQKKIVNNLFGKFFLLIFALQKRTKHLKNKTLNTLTL